MTIHLVKLCVGAQKPSDLDDWVKRRTRDNKKAGRANVHDHVTRMRPKREDELLDGGSIYWVIKGVVLVRQKLIGFDERIGADGIRRCAILIEPPLIETEPQPRRAFQGWRYLLPEDAPGDLGARTPNGAPPELSAELAKLGLI